MGEIDFSWYTTQFSFYDKVKLGVNWRYYNFSIDSTNPGGQSRTHYTFRQLFVLERSFK